MPPSFILLALIISLSSFSSCFPDPYVCYTDARMPMLAPDACTSTIQRVLGQEFAQDYLTFGQTTAPGVRELPLTWYGLRLAVPTKCVMQMDGVIGQARTLKLRDKAASLANVERRCIAGTQHRGGMVALVSDSAVWMEIYALSDDDYESMLKTRSGELTGNKTGGGFLSGPGLGHGSTLNGSVS